MELQLKSNWEIRISHTLNGGFIVSVGCANFSYASAALLCRDLREYLNDPKTYEDKYYELMKEKGQQLEMPVPPPSETSGETVGPDTGAAESNIAEQEKEQQEDSA